MKDRKRETYPMKRLLFVDDDKYILDVNRIYFEKLNYVVDTCEDSGSALKLLEEHVYDVLILDIRLNNIDGVELCRMIRTRCDTPVIFLTNMTEESILVESFKAGGDDYLTKPYMMKELEMRIWARIQKRKSSPTVEENPRLEIHKGEKQAYINGYSLGLTLSEFEILQFLVTHSGTAFSQEEIYKALWGEQFYNTHSIQVLIMHIRRKIQKICPNASLIKTKWGKGYVYTE